MEGTQARHDHLLSRLTSMLGSEAAWALVAYACGYM